MGQTVPQSSVCQCATWVGIASSMVHRFIAPLLMWPGTGGKVTRGQGRLLRDCLRTGALFAISPLAYQLLFISMPPLVISPSLSTVSDIHAILFIERMCLRKGPPCRVASFAARLFHARWTVLHMTHYDTLPLISGDGTGLHVLTFIRCTVT
jgi:hypothetical protein